MLVSSILMKLLTAHAYNFERVAVVVHVDADGHLVQRSEVRVLVRRAKLAEQRPAGQLARL